MTAGQLLYESKLGQPLAWNELTDRQRDWYEDEAVRRIAHYEKLEQVLRDVYDGLSFAYDCLELGLYDEAMLNIGSNHSKLIKELNND